MKKLFFLFIVYLIQVSPIHGQDIIAKDSILSAIYPKYDSVTNTHRFWLGANNRKLWALRTKIRYINLAAENGGMSVIKLGGGFQTRSLRLKDKEGDEWVIRTLQKYPERKLAENLKHTVIVDILQDQVSAINPYGALVVPTFATALDIPHSVPEIVYIGDDPQLGKFQQEFANGVYLMERRVPEEDAKSEKTEKVQKKLLGNNKASVNQHLVLRARLLDILLGDWDRHEDQWRWEIDTLNGKRIYNPIPRDRDQVFYKTSGVFPFIVSHQWLKSRFQPYGGKLRDVKGWNFGARYFDRYFLNSLDEGEWSKEIAYVQSVVTDSLIDQALAVLPDTVRIAMGKEIVNNLKTRRTHLATSAKEYYKFISKTVDIPGSKKGESFELKVLSPKLITVTVHDLKKNGTLNDLIYERTFDADVTDEIRLYGIDGADVFKVEGQGKLPVKVRLIGGTHHDSFYVSEGLNSKNNLVIYDNLETGNVLPERDKAKVRLSGDSLVNEYDSKAFKYGRTGPAVLANYNIDQGLLLKVGFLDERQGFRKSPYASHQEYWSNYSTGRQSLSFSYKGSFIGAVGKNDLLIDANVYGPNNFGNFFGLGNDTEFNRDNDRDISYYRNRFDHAEASIQLRRHINPHWQVQYGIATQYYTSTIKNNSNRYLEFYSRLPDNADVFGNHFYLGGTGSITYDNRKKNALAERGIYWKTDFSANESVSGPAKFYSRIATRFSTNISIKDSTIVLANSFGGGVVFGKPMFFQQMTLGGGDNLRGFHTNRFTGKAMAFYNLELRAKLFDFNTYILPGTFGVVGFNDVGRIWQPGEDSKTWHHGYGGGIFINPADVITIQALVGFSKEGSIPYVTIGFQF